MESRVALIGIIVENTDSVTRLNDLLHEYGNYIIGRMGIPHKERHMNIISIVMDAHRRSSVLYQARLVCFPE